MQNYEYIKQQTRQALASKGIYVDDDKLEQFIKSRVQNTESVNTPIDQRAAQRAELESIGYIFDKPEEKPAPPPKSDDNALMDFVGNMLWGATSSATMGLAELSPGLKDFTGLGVVDDFMQESGWGKAGRAVGEAVGFLVPLKPIGMATRGAVKALSGASTKALAKKAADKSVQSLLKHGVSKEVSEGIIEKAMISPAGKTFAREIGVGLRASDDAVKLSSRNFKANVDAAFVAILDKAGRPVTAKTVKKFSDEFFETFVNSKRHVNSIGQWVETAMGMGADVGLKRFAARYLGKALELSADFMIYNQVSSAIEDKVLGGQEWKPWEVALHTAAFSFVLPFIEFIPGGKAVGGSIRRDVKNLKRILNKKTDYAALDKEALNGYLKIVGRAAELQNYNYGMKTFTKEMMEKGLVPRKDAIKILEQYRKMANKDLKKMLVKETGLDFLESIPRMVVGSAFFNSDLVRDAELWKNTSPEELMTHLLIGAFFVRKRGLPISQEKMARYHVTGEDYRSKEALAEQLGYDTTQIEIAVKYMERRHMAQHMSLSFSDNPAYRETEELFNAVRKEAEKGESQLDLYSDKTLDRKDKLGYLYSRIMLPVEYGRKEAKGEELKEGEIIQLENLSEGTINSLYEKVMSIKTPVYDLATNKIKMQEGGEFAEMTTIKELGVEGFDRQLNMSISNEWTANRIELAKLLADILEVPVSEGAGGRLTFTPLNWERAGEQNIGELRRYEEIIQKLEEMGIVDHKAPQNITEVSKDAIVEAEGLVRRADDVVLEKIMGSDIQISMDKLGDVLWEGAVHNRRVQNLEFTYQVLLSENPPKHLSESQKTTREIAFEIFGIKQRTDGGVKISVIVSWDSISKDKKWDVKSEDAESARNEADLWAAMQSLHNILKIGRREMQVTSHTIDREKAESLVTNLRENNFSISTPDGQPFTDVMAKYTMQRMLGDRNITHEMVHILEALTSGELAAIKDGFVDISSLDAMRKHLSHEAEGSDLDGLMKKYEYIHDILSDGLGLFIRGTDSVQVPNKGHGWSASIKDIYETLPSIHEKHIGRRFRSFERVLHETNSLGDFKALKDSYETMLADPSKENVASLGSTVEIILEKALLSTDQRQRLEELQVNLKEFGVNPTVEALKFVQYTAMHGDKSVVEVIDTMVSGGSHYGAVNKLLALINKLNEGGRNKNQNAIDAYKKLKNWFLSVMESPNNLESKSLEDLYTAYVESGHDMKKLGEYVQEVDRVYLGALSKEDYQKQRSAGALRARQIFEHDGKAAARSLDAIANEYDPEGKYGLKEDGVFNQEWRERLQVASKEIELEIIKGEMFDKLAKKYEASEVERKLAEFEERHWPVIVRASRGSVNQESVRVEIINDGDGGTRVFLRKDTQNVMRGSLNDFMEQLEYDRIRSFNLFGSGTVDGYTHSLNSIDKIEKHIESGSLSIEKRVINDLRAGEEVSAELDPERMRFFSVELGQGAGIVVESSPEKILNVFKPWYEQKLKDLKTDSSVAARVFENLFKSANQAGELTSGAMRVIIRSMYYDQHVSTLGFNKMMEVLSYSETSEIQKRQAKFFKYVHIAQSDRYVKGDPELLFNISRNKFSFLGEDGNRVEVESGVSRETRDAIRRLEVRDEYDNVVNYGLNITVVADETGNINSPFNVRGELIRQEQYEIDKLLKLNNLTAEEYGKPYKGDRAKLDQDQQIALAKIDRKFEMIKELENNEMYKSLDASNVDAQAYLSEDAARLMFAQQGMRLTDGYGGMKPTIHQNSRYTVLIGKTNFIYDPAVAKVMEKKGIHILMGESAAKQYHIEPFSLDDVRLNYEKENMIADLFEQGFKNASLPLHQLMITDIYFGPAASAVHGAKYLPSQSILLDRLGMDSFQERANYKKLIDQYKHGMAETDAFFDGIADVLAKLPAEQLMPYEEGSYGLSALLLEMGLSARDPLVMKDTQAWYHRDFMKRIKGQSAPGAISVARPGVGERTPIFNNVYKERRQVFFGTTTVAYEVRDQKVKDISELLFAFERVDRKDKKYQVRDVLVFRENGKWVIEDPLEKDWASKPNKHELEMLDSIKNQFDKALEGKGGKSITVFDVFEILEEGKGAISLMAGVYRIPRKHLADVSLDRIAGFSHEHLGNTQAVSPFSTATTHQGDFDVDKYNTILSLGGPMGRRFFRNAGTVVDSYTQEVKEHFIDMFENGHGEKSAGDEANRDGIGKYKEKLDQTRKMVGQVVNMLATVTHASNAMMKVDGKSITDMTSRDSKSIGQRLANTAQEILDVFTGIHSLALAKRESLYRYILFGEAPDGFDGKLLAKDKVEEMDFKPLFDFSEHSQRVVMQDAVMEAITALNQLQKLFPGTYTEGVNRDLTYKEIREIYKKTANFFADPTRNILTRLARKHKGDVPYLRDLADAFIKPKEGATQVDYNEIIKGFKKGDIPALHENIIEFDYEHGGKGKIAQLFDLSATGRIINGIASSDYHSHDTPAWNGNSKKQREFLKANDLFFVHIENHLNLIRAFGGEITSESGIEMLDTASKEVYKNYRTEMNETQRLSLLHSIVDNNIDYASHSLRKTVERKQSTDSEKLEAQDKIEVWQEIKGWLDHKSIENITKENVVTIKSVSMDNKLTYYKVPESTSGTHFIYEIHKGYQSIEKLKKALETKEQDAILKDLLTFVGTAEGKKSVKLYAGKRYAILKNPIKIEYFNNRKAAQGRALFKMIEGSLGTIHERNPHHFGDMHSRANFYNDVRILKGDLYSHASDAFNVMQNASHKSKEGWVIEGSNRDAKIREFFEKYDDMETIDLVALLLEPDMAIRTVTKVGGGIYTPTPVVNERLMKGVFEYLRKEDPSLLREFVSHYSDYYRYERGEINKADIDFLFPPSMLNRKLHSVADNYIESLKPAVKEILYGSGFEPHRGILQYNVEAEKNDNVKITTTGKTRTEDYTPETGKIKTKIEVQKSDFGSKQRKRKEGC